MASASTPGPDEPGTPSGLVPRLLERIRSLEHQLYSVTPPDSAEEAPDAFSRLTTLVKRAQTGLDTGLAYMCVLGAGPVLMSGWAQPCQQYETGVPFGKEKRAVT